MGKFELWDNPLRRDRSSIAGDLELEASKVVSEDGSRGGMDLLR